MACSLGLLCFNNELLLGIVANYFGLLGFLGGLGQESRLPLTVEARKLAHGRPPTQNQRKKEHQHKSSYMHVVIFFGIY